MDTVFPFANVISNEFIVFAWSSEITKLNWGWRLKDLKLTSLIFFPIEAIAPFFKKLVASKVFSLLTNVSSNFASSRGGSL